jgi:hypothetical protein
MEFHDNILWRRWCCRREPQAGEKSEGFFNLIGCSNDRLQQRLMRTALPWTPLRQNPGDMLNIYNLNEK